MALSGSGANLNDVSAKVIDNAVQGFKAEYIEVRAQRLLQNFDNC
jgi:hypothetical protein